MHYDGACHCGNISLVFETDIEPQATTILTCQCSYCRKHGARATSDPNGQFSITVKQSDKLNRYSFGLKTADYLICRHCGTYVAAVTNADPPKAIVIVNSLTDRDKFSSAPAAVEYSDESREARVERRAKNWTPVSLQYSD
ncbi:MAG: hypothetical protein GKS02_03190 [Alphaproteobacteria bacterium]|nr:hypothetical protein [Alphaproteobacteria bacterium]